MTVSERKADADAFSQADWDEVADNPDFTDAELTELRPAHELPAEIYAALPKNRGGRPRATFPKAQVTLRIDRSVLDAYRKTGPGWQTRMNAVLFRALEDPNSPLWESDARARTASGIWRQDDSGEIVVVAADRPFPPSPNVERNPRRPKKAG